MHKSLTIRLARSRAAPLCCWLPVFSQTHTVAAPGDDEIASFADLYLPENAAHEEMEFARLERLGDFRAMFGDVAWNRVSKLPELTLNPIANQPMSESAAGMAAAAGAAMRRH